MSGTIAGGLRQVALTVSDVDNALGFYRDVLGLAFLFRAGPGLAFLDAEGVRLMLSTPQGAGEPGRNSVLYFGVRDIVAAFEACVPAVRSRNAHPHWRRGCPTMHCGSAFCAIPTAISSG